MRVQHCDVRAIGSESKSYSRALLVVHTRDLLKYRSIYIDPESIPKGADYRPGVRDYLGETLVVLGGIPIACVINIGQVSAIGDS